MGVPARARGAWALGALLAGALVLGVALLARPDGTRAAGPGGRTHGPAPEGGDGATVPASPGESGPDAGVPAGGSAGGEVVGPSDPTEADPGPHPAGAASAAGHDPWAWPAAWDADTPRVPAPRLRVVDAASGLPVPGALVRRLRAAPDPALDLDPEAARAVLAEGGTWVRADARGELTLGAGAWWLHARRGLRASAPAANTRHLAALGLGGRDACGDVVLLVDRWTAPVPPPPAAEVADAADAADAGSGGTGAVLELPVPAGAVVGSGADPDAPVPVRHVVQLIGADDRPLEGARLHRTGVPVDPAPGSTGCFHLDLAPGEIAPLWAWAPGHAALRLELSGDTAEREHRVPLERAPRVRLRVPGASTLRAGTRRLGLAARRTVFDGVLRRAEVAERAGFDDGRALVLELPDAERWELWWLVFEEGRPEPVAEYPVFDAGGATLVLDGERFRADGPLASLVGDEVVLSAPPALDVPAAGDAADDGNR